MDTLATITRGDNEAFTGQVLQSEGGLPRDIANDTLKFTVKQKETDSTFILQKTTTAGGITKTNAAQGLYSITIDKTDLLTLTSAKTGARAFYCDVELTDQAGKVTTLGKWRLPVELDITTS